MESRASCRPLTLVKPLLLTYNFAERIFKRHSMPIYSQSLWSTVSNPNYSLTRTLDTIIRDKEFNLCRNVVGDFVNSDLYIIIGKGIMEDILLFPLCLGWPSSGVKYDCGETQFNWWPKYSWRVGLNLNINIVRLVRTF
jgi:hypothetical protein